MIDLGDLERAGYTLNRPIFADSIGFFGKVILMPDRLTIAVHVKLHVLEATGVYKTDGGREFSVGTLVQDRDTVTSIETFFIDLWDGAKDRSVLA